MNATAVKNATEISKKYKKRSQLADIWLRFKRNKSAVLGLICFLVIVLLIILADVFYDYDMAIKQNIPDRLLPLLTPGHILGTDDMGRDMAARILHGGRLSLCISISSVVISLIAGVVLGCISGYYGGVIDNVIMRIVDIMMAIPMTLLAIAIVAALGASMTNMIIALSISQIPSFARVARGAVLTVRDTEYIEAAKAIGAKDRTIILSHILPNSLSPVIVQIAIRTAVAITNTAALSFLGLGIKPPVPEWGGMLSSGRTYIRDYSYMTYIPGLAMMLTILSLNLIGDGLRDALDPRLK